MFGQPDKNPNGLRVIKTARTFDAINAGAKEGFLPLVKRVKPGKDIHSIIEVHQHQETGEIELSTDGRNIPSEGYECVISFHPYYPYSFPAPFAAYLVPPGLKNGERVWLEDIIEDIVAVFGNQGWNPRLEWCEAIWTGDQFDVQFDPDKDAPELIG
ncbi:MAG: hypothetical protein WCK17_14450 [Verrucomicrobiota bacterium]